MILTADSLLGPVSPFRVLQLLRSTGSDFPLVGRDALVSTVTENVAHPKKSLGRCASSVSLGFHRMAAFSSIADPLVGCNGIV